MQPRRETQFELSTYHRMETDGPPQVPGRPPSWPVTRTPMSDSEETYCKGLIAEGGFPAYTDSIVEVPKAVLVDFRTDMFQQSPASYSGLITRTPRNMGRARASTCSLLDGLQRAGRMTDDTIADVVNRYIQMEQTSPFSTRVFPRTLDAAAEEECEELQSASSAPSSRLITPAELNAPLPGENEAHTPEHQILNVSAKSQTDQMNGSEHGLGLSFDDDRVSGSASGSGRRYHSPLDKEWRYSGSTFGSFSDGPLSALKARKPTPIAKAQIRSPEELREAIRNLPSNRILEHEIEALQNTPSSRGSKRKAKVTPKRNRDTRAGEQDPSPASEYSNPSPTADRSLTSSSSKSICLTPWQKHILEDAPPMPEQSTSSRSRHQNVNNKSERASWRLFPVSPELDGRRDSDPFDGGWEAIASGKSSACDPSRLSSGESQRNHDSELPFLIDAIQLPSPSTSTITAPQNGNPKPESHREHDTAMVTKSNAHEKTIPQRSFSSGTATPKATRRTTIDAPVVFASINITQEGMGEPCTVKFSYKKMYTPDKYKSLKPSEDTDIFLETGCIQFCQPPRQRPLWLFRSDLPPPIAHIVIICPANGSVWWLPPAPLDISEPGVWTIRSESSTCLSHAVFKYIVQDGPHQSDRHLKLVTPFMLRVSPQFFGQVDGLPNLPRGIPNIDSEGSATATGPVASLSWAPAVSLLAPGETRQDRKQARLPTDGKVPLASNLSVRRPSVPAPLEIISYRQFVQNGVPTPYTITPTGLAVLFANSHQEDFVKYSNPAQGEGDILDDSQTQRSLSDQGFPRTALTLSRPARPSTAATPSSNSFTVRSNAQSHSHPNTEKSNPASVDIVNRWKHRLPKIPRDFTSPSKRDSRFIDATPSGRSVLSEMSSNTQLHQDTDQIQTADPSTSVSTAKRFSPSATIGKGLSLFHRRNSSRSSLRPNLTSIPESSTSITTESVNGATEDEIILLSRRQIRPHTSPHVDGQRTGRLKPLFPASSTSTGQATKPTGLRTFHAGPIRGSTSVDGSLNSPSTSMTISNSDNNLSRFVNSNTIPTPNVNSSFSSTSTLKSSRTANPYPNPNPNRNHGPHRHLLKSKFSNSLEEFSRKWKNGKSPAPSPDFHSSISNYSSNENGKGGASGDVSGSGIVGVGGIGGRGANRGKVARGWRPDTDTRHPGAASLTGKSGTNNYSKANPKSTLDIYPSHSQAQARSAMSDTALVRDRIALEEENKRARSGRI